MSKFKVLFVGDNHCASKQPPGRLDNYCETSAKEFLECLQIGRDIKVDAGQGISSGGTVKVRGGYTDTGAGGFVEITAGESSNGTGGSVLINAGIGNGNLGGSINITSERHKFFCILKW